MIQKITFKKLGNHWYPCLEHESLSDLGIDPVFERLFNIMDKYNDEVINVYLYEESSIIINEGLIQFTEEDILRYLTTNDYFIMDLYIEDHKFSISSKLYQLLEQNYNFNFHKFIYRIEVEHGF